MKKVCLHTDKYASRVKLYEDVPQEEMENSDNFFNYVKDPKYIHCPYNHGLVCGSTCAWFDIEYVNTPNLNPHGFSPDHRVITCKGTPIGELVEEGIED